MILRLFVSQFFQISEEIWKLNSSLAKKSKIPHCGFWLFFIQGVRAHLTERGECEHRIPSKKEGREWW